MSETAKAKTDLRPVAGSPGDVDGVLRAFFRAEMPEPWPAARLDAGAETGPAGAVAPQEEGAVARRGGVTLVQARWALAASVLVLLGGFALLSRTFPEVAFTPTERGALQDVGTGPQRPTKLTPEKNGDRAAPAASDNSRR